MALNSTPSNSEVAELCTVKNTLNTVTVMPSTHFIMLFNSFDIPVKVICGLILDIKLSTAAAIAAGKMKPLIISTAAPDKKTAEG